MFDILAVCETKLDETFPSSQFHMDGFSLPYRLDRNRNSEGVMIFVKEDIPSKHLTNGFSVTYHPSAQNDQYFFNCIDKALDTYSNYDNVLLAEDFNVEDDEPCLSNFLYQHDLYNLAKVGACFNSSKPTSTDLFLTTKNRHFQL